jgi:ATP-dependent Clp protease ATP-binding subunit ClpC
VFKRFTERARQVVVLAQDEARALKHNYIGTEHILLGLLREEEGLAARVLESLDITVEEARAQVARIVGQGDEVTRGQIPFTPRAKKVLELALRESQSLGHNYIGTEHILLGLVRENEGVASRILDDRFDAGAEKIRNEIIRMLSGPGARQQQERFDPQIEEIREQKEAAIEAQDFQRAAALRDVERKLVRERGPQPGVRVSSVHRGTVTLHPTRWARIWAQWPSMLTGAALLGFGILIGRLI